MANPVVEPTPNPAVPGSAEAPVRGETALRRVEGWFHRVDAAIERSIPPPLNPLTQTGAIANTMLLVATVTGVLLLLWYVPTVQRAYESVEGMMRQPLGAGLVRALHRYSSDASVFFILVHGLRMFIERRFTGARWLAWVTGVLATVLLWSIGWSGYWLVWDRAGQVVAVESARFLDALPIFIEPLQRSFLTAGSINSLLFLLVFFFHMLVPVALGVALWLHISRVSRSRFLTDRPMTIWCLITLVVLSLLAPAGLHERASMASIPRELVADAWYLFPLWVTGHLGTGALWSATLALVIALIGVPWWLRRGRQQVSLVDESRCNACAQCVADCPYAAITMAPRTDDRRFSARAVVDPDLCIGCGICAGSCDSSAIGLSWLAQPTIRLQIDAWAQRVSEHPGLDHLVLGCAESAAGEFTDDATTGHLEGVPGARFLPVPCAGWVHALTVERALRKGFSRVTVVACPGGACRYREGSRWTHERLRGDREPSLRVDRVDPAALAVVEYGRGRHRALHRALSGEGGAAPRARSAAIRWVFGVVLAAGLAAIVGAGSHVGISLPTSSDGAELVVSFKHAVSVAENCYQRSEAELEALPYHMRRPDVCERRRPPVRIEIEVDGEVRHARTIPPTGLWGDGFSLELVELPLPVGERRVAVRIAEGEDSPWRWHDERVVALNHRQRVVVLFDREAGFTWHGAVEEGP